MINLKKIDSFIYEWALVQPGGWRYRWACRFSNATQKIFEHLSRK